jgi:8-oxo-dGTP diphosphatase
MKSVRVVYGARVVGGELTHEVDGTTDEARWIPLADVPSLARVPLVDAALAMWRQGQSRPRWSRAR